jgi:hypothetical protein
MPTDFGGQNLLDGAAKNVVPMTTAAPGGTMTVEYWRFRPRIRAEAGGQPAVTPITPKVLYTDLLNR